MFSVKYPIVNVFGFAGQSLSKLLSSAVVMQSIT